MKKLTLSIGLVAAMLSAKSQDTINLVITLDKVYYYKSNEIKPYYEYFHNDSIFFDVKENECIKYLFYEKINKTRKFTRKYPNGKIVTWNASTKDDLYITPSGPFKLEIE